MHGKGRTGNAFFFWTMQINYTKVNTDAETVILVLKQETIQQKKFLQKKITIIHDNYLK